MPRPNPGESEQAYVSRFMASAEAQKDFPDEKQRAAVAYSMFKEKKNDLYLCPECGAEMETGRSSERILQCAACGGQVVDATPPTESIRNLCPHCRHQMEPEHDDLGCHAEGCSCTEAPAMALALGNSEAEVRLPSPGSKCPNCGAGKIKEYEDKSTGCDSCGRSYRRAPENANADPAKKWAVLDRPGRESVMKSAGVGGYAYHEFDEIYTPHAKKLAEVLERENASADRGPAHPPKFKAGDKVRAEGYGFDMLVTGHRVLDTGPGTDMHHYTLKDPTSGQTTEKPEGSLRRAENANGDAARICKPCLDAVVRSGGALSGKETYPDSGGLNHIVTKNGPGHVETACGAEPCCENTNAKPVNHAWHAAKDAWYDHYNDCETCQREDGPGGGYCTRGSALYQTFKSEDAKALGNTDTCQKCASGAFFSSYKDHEKSCAQCGSASSEGALCAEGRKLYDAMEHDHLTHEARNRKETVAEAFARLKLEAEKWWDEKGQPDRELALKRAGLPADTEAVKLGWAALPAATRKAVVEAMNDGYRHEINNAGKLPSGWRVYPASEFKDADGNRPDWATSKFYVLDSGTNPVGEGDTREAAIADALAHRPVSNADPKADQAATISARLRDILAAHGSAMIRKRGSSAPLIVKSAAEAGDLSQVTDVDVPQGVSNGTGQGPRHKDLFKEWYELDKKQDELTRQLHDLEAETGAGGRDSDPKRAPLLAEMKRVEQALGAIMAKDAEERRNARGSELAKKLGVAHPKDLPFDQINEHGCNGCDDIRAPLNADGYCKECAAEQGAFVNADEPASRYNPDGSIKGQCGKVGCPCALYPNFHAKKNAGPGFPLSYFKRPDAKERADSQGIEDMEDEDLTPAGLKAKREAIAEIGGLDNAVSGIQHVGPDQRQADGEAVYGSVK